VLRKFIDFLANEDGPTAVEYAIMLALIIAVCIVAIGSVGQNAANLFQDSGGELDTFLN
jgi:pilus assembly protein Flp/PilA